MVDIVSPVGRVLALTIPNGQALSAPGNVEGFHIVGLIPPAAWTAAVLTFRASIDGSVWNDLYDDATERQIASASLATGRWIRLDGNLWRGISTLILRSGPAAGAVNQAADRVLQLILEPRP